MPKMVCILLVTIVVAFGYNVKANEFEPVVPEKCKELGYCLDEDVPYPTEHVDQLFATTPDIATNFDVIDLTDGKGNTRRSEPGEEFDLCEMKQQVIRPRIAQDESNAWWYLLHQNELSPGWRVETCVKEGKACNPALQEPPGYKSQCSQKFMSQYTQVLDKDGKPVTKALKIPYTCYCKIDQEEHHPPWPTSNEPNGTMFIVPIKLKLDDQIIITGQMSDGRLDIALRPDTYKYNIVAEVNVFYPTNEKNQDHIKLTKELNGKQVTIERELYKATDYFFDPSFDVRFSLTENGLSISIGESYLESIELDHRFEDIRFISVKGDVKKLAFKFNAF